MIIEPTSHNRRSRSAKLTASFVAIFVALIFPLASSAAGHAALQGSNPKDGAKIGKMPTKVEFTLNEEVRPPAFVVVASSDGKRINGEETTVDGKTVSTQIIAAMKPGKYTAAYRIVSMDAHPVTGKVNFEVAGTPKPAETTSTPSPATPLADTTIDDSVEPPGNSDSYIVILFTAILAAGVIVFMVKGVRARDDD